MQKQRLQHSLVTVGPVQGFGHKAGIGLQNNAATAAES